MIDEERLKEIGPYDDFAFHQKMSELVREPGFLHALSYTMPREEIPALMDELLKIRNKYDFQHQIMFPFMEMLAKATTAGITLGGAKYYNPALNYTFITNHRRHRQQPPHLPLDHRPRQAQQLLRCKAQLFFAREPGER